MMHDKQIASAAAAEWLARLRNWTGFDAQRFHHERLIEIIAAAIADARAKEDLQERNHIDGRFRAFVDRACAETLATYQHHHEFIDGKQ